MQIAPNSSPPIKQSRFILTYLRHAYLYLDRFSSANILEAIVGAYLKLNSSLKNKEYPLNKQSFNNIELCMKSLGLIEPLMLNIKQDLKSFFSYVLLFRPLLSGLKRT